MSEDGGSSKTINLYEGVSAPAMRDALKEHGYKRCNHDAVSGNIAVVYGISALRTQAPPTPPSPQ